MSATEGDQLHVVVHVDRLAAATRSAGVGNAVNLEPCPDLVGNLASRVRAGRDLDGTREHCTVRTLYLDEGVGNRSTFVENSQAETLTLDTTSRDGGSGTTISPSDGISRREQAANLGIETNTLDAPARGKLRLRVLRHGLEDLVIVTQLLRQEPTLPDALILGPVRPG